MKALIYVLAILFLSTGLATSSQAYDGVTTEEIAQAAKELETATDNEVCEFLRSGLGTLRSELPKKLDAITYMVSIGVWCSAKQRIATMTIVGGLPTPDFASAVKKANEPIICKQDKITAVIGKRGWSFVNVYVFKNGSTRSVTINCR